jgi:hypothetical protein
MYGVQYRVFIWAWRRGLWSATIALFRGDGRGAYFFPSCGGTKQRWDEMRVARKYETSKVHLPPSSTLMPVICAPISHHAPSAHAGSVSFGVLTMHSHPIRVIIACLGRPLAVRQHPVGDRRAWSAELVGRHHGWVFCSLTANLTGWACQPETDCPCVGSCGKATVGKHSSP